jgi:putative Holliday junction resolvase
LALERILAVDVGEVRFGLAQSDPMGIFASPVGTFDQAALLDRIAQICTQSTVKTVVVGWPMTMRGHEGEATRRSERFIQTLTARFPTLSAVPFDERLTSVMAQRTILDSGVSKKRRQEKGLVDAVAATHLLQLYLDQRR